ncbi:MAG: D-aminoacylase [Bacteroidetes bacterium]|nr:D-aminoacylase [Bacteroidota bacterium]
MLRLCVRFPILVVAVAFFVSCSAPADFETLLTGGTIYDGSGETPYVADVGIRADTIAAIGDLSEFSAAQVKDVSGLAVSPGFINMLSWATTSLIEDGRSMSDILQGVTLEIFGEGWSLGPQNDAMKEESINAQSDIKYDIDWTTLGEYLSSLERRGISPNVASFIGATTVRIHELQEEDRPPTADELERMKQLVREAMEEGALGLGSSLIYTPAFYADTEELIELARVAAEYGGMYISHIRSEGNRLLEAVDELIEIAREANIRAEIYHLKAAGQQNWDKLEDVIRRVETARAEGLAITADMYTYTAGSTGLDAAMPPWVQEGGYGAWRSRLQDPSIRSRLIEEMSTPTDEWENLYLAAGAEGMLLAGFRQDSLRYLIGKTLSEAARLRGASPEETAIDLVVADSSRVDVVYFLMSEENVRRQIRIPWISFGSDAGSLNPEGVFLNSQPHPRAYGNFARLLGKYSRDEGLIPLEEAIRRLTSQPAENLRLDRRGRLAEGYFADIAIFDPDTIIDHATFDDPHQLATGMIHVWVNGQIVLENGVHTGATPGRFVKRAGTGK